MRLGIMQPYFAPSLAYFDLIRRCDRWIVFDTSQFRRKSWMTRNRILHPSEGWQYVTAHVQKHPLQTPLHDVRLHPSPDWREHMLAQLEHYRRTAPYFDRTLGLLRDALTTARSSLVELSVELLARVCRLLEIPFEPEIASQQDVELGPIEGPGDWALRWCEALGADRYLNPPGGAGLFDRERFARSGIELEIHRFAELQYQPRGYAFVPMLSVLDVLMWNPVETIVAHLESS